MLKKRTKNKNMVFGNIVISIFAVFCVFVDCYAAAAIYNSKNQQPVIPIIGSETETEETHPRGFKVENAQYYDYVGYDDQGRLVDKNNIIIGKGEGGAGGGGGSSGTGSKSADSSGNSSNGTSGNISDQPPGQSGTDNSPGGKTKVRNIIGANGNQTSNIEQKKKEAAEEEARQQSIEAELATAGARRNQIIESINQRSMQESKEKESSRQESMKAEALNKARSQTTTKTLTTQSTNGRVVEKKDIVETETITYKPDEVTRAPINQTEKAMKENQPIERLTQPRPVFDDTIPTVIVPETLEETSVNTPDMYLPEVTSTIPSVTEGPEKMIEETTIIESEVVTIEETTPTPTTKPTVKSTTAPIDEKTKGKDAPNENQKEGEKGEKNHDDKEAEQKKELGVNKEDGRGDGVGSVHSGIKIFELDRKGNIGIRERAGINNIEGYVAGIVISMLLLIGVLQYYIPYIIKPKNIKSDFIS